MIGALALALQLAAASPSVVSIRSATGETAVPIAQTSAGPAVAVADLAPVMPVAIRPLAAGRWQVVTPAGEMEVLEQVPFLRLDGRVIPLAGAPHVERGRLHVPLQVVSELLPRLAPEQLRYNPLRAELRYTPRPEVERAPVLASRTPRVVNAAAPRRAAPAVRRPSGGRRRRVVVDAGHGGPDRGMTGPIGGSFTIHEKDITLAVSKRLEAALRARGVDVIMTRTTDTLIALADRGRIANREHGDLFISIHVNAANPRWKSPGGARGFETYFLSEAKTEDEARVAQMENESVRFEAQVNAAEGDPLSFIMNDMAQNEHLRESLEVAELVQGRLAGIHTGPNRGVKQANFAVLRGSFMPAVLVELGFGTNPDEARFLKDPARQHAMAEAIADAAMDYLGRYERRLGAAP